MKKRLSEKDFRKLLECLNEDKNRPKVDYSKMVNIYAKEKEEKEG